MKIMKLSILPKILILSVNRIHYDEEGNLKRNFK